MAVVTTGILAGLSIGRRRPLATRRGASPAPASTAPAKSAVDPTPLSAPATMRTTTARELGRIVGLMLPRGFRASPRLTFTLAALLGTCATCLIALGNAHDRAESAERERLVAREREAARALEVERTRFEAARAGEAAERARLADDARGLEAASRKLEEARAAHGEAAKQELAAVERARAEAATWARLRSRPETTTPNGAPIGSPQAASIRTERSLSARDGPDAAERRALLGPALPGNMLDRGTIELGHVAVFSHLGESTRDAEDRARKTPARRLHWGMWSSPRHPSLDLLRAPGEDPARPALWVGRELVTRSDYNRFRCANAPERSARSEDLGSANQPMLATASGAREYARWVGLELLEPRDLEVPSVEAIVEATAQAGYEEWARVAPTANGDDGDDAARAFRLVYRETP